MIKFQENARTDGRMESRTEGRADLSYRTLPTTAGGPKGM